MKTLMTHPGAAVAVCIATAIATAAGVLAAWQDYAVFVLIFLALYFLEGMWAHHGRTPLRHALTAGVLLGVTCGTLMLIYQYNSGELQIP
jgi:hypothetical protein